MNPNERCGSTVRKRRTASVLCLAGCAWLAFSSARAQAERHGVRVHYTSIASAGGLEGRAFLPVASEGTIVGPHPNPNCTGTQTLTVRAAVNRGPLRSLVLRLPKKPGRAPLSGDACSGAELQVTMEDRSVLHGGQGYVAIDREPTPDDPTFRGTFAQTVSYRGAPITIEGTFVLKAPSAAPNR